MTNEEALIHGQEDKPKDLYMEGWNAAIAYMQEQSEPVAWMKPDGSVCSKAFKNTPPNTEYDAMFTIPLFTTPQRDVTSTSGMATRPLKRLSDDEILKIGKNLATMLPNPSIDLDYANTIMDEIERINNV